MSEVVIAPIRRPVYGAPVKRTRLAAASEVAFTAPFVAPTSIPSLSSRMNYQNPLLLSAVIGALTSVSFTASAQQSMVAYAAECDAQIGVSVPQFNCNDGTLIPGQGTGDTKNDGPCDNPQMFSSGSHCNPGSRLKKLYEDDDVFIVAVCRKETESVSNSNRYDDVAVIQHNRDNGATCFYQRQENSEALIEDPSNASTANEWFAPSNSTTYVTCPTCHDGNALIRSPFLTAVTGPNALPGTGNLAFNAKNQPYWLVGDLYTDRQYRAVSVDADNNSCTSCHRLGAMTYTSGNKQVWRMNGYTSGGLHLSRITVKSLEELQNPVDYPYDLLRAVDPDSDTKWWMPFGRTSYNEHVLGHSAAQWEAEYEQLFDCKNQLRDEIYDNPTTQPLALPNDPNCRVSFVPEIRNRPGLRIPSENLDYRIGNTYHPYDYLYSDGNTVESSQSGMLQEGGNWLFERTGVDRFRIKNSETGEYLCHSLVNSNSWVGPCGASGPLGRDWIVDYQPANDRVYRFKSQVFPNKYLHMEYGYLAFGTINAGWQSAWWYTSPQG